MPLPPVNQEYTDRKFTLVEVRDDRYKDRFEPPREHLGHKIDGHSPIEVAQLAINYTDDLISAARELECKVNAAL